MRVLYEAVKKGGTAVTVVPLIFLHLALDLRILRSPDISENRACRIVALSHGDRGGYSICYYVKNIGKYHKVQESTGNYRKTGKSGKRFCRTVALFCE